MPMIDQDNQHVDFTSARDILTSIFKHKYKVLAAFIVIFAAALIGASQLRQVYEAKSVLLIKLGREFYNRPEGAAGGSSIPPDSITKSEISILTSHDLLGKIAKVVGPVVLYPQLERVPEGAREGAAVSLLERDLTVSTIGSTLLDVRIANSNAKVAAEATNTLVDAFKDRHLEVFGGKSTEFLESQKQAYEEKLKESENRLAGFKERNKVFSIQEQKASLVAQRSAVETSLVEVQGKISELEQNAALIRSPKWAVETPPEIRAELAALKQKERDALEKHTETSRVVQNVRQQIQEVEDSVRQNAEELRQKDLAKAEGDLKVARAKADGLRRMAAQIDGNISFLESHSVALQDLNREVAQEEQNYGTYSRKLEESLISDDMDRRKMVAISVIEKASIPSAHRKRKLGKEQIIGAGFLGGIAGGLALALLLEFLAPGMTTPLSAQRRLNLPVLVAIGMKE